MGWVSAAGGGLAPGLGPQLTSGDSRLCVKAQESALNGAGGAFGLHELGVSVLIGPWGTHKSMVVTTWASNLMSELATFFLGERGGHWKNQLGCVRLHFTSLLRECWLRSPEMYVKNLAFSES